MAVRAGASTFTMSLQNFKLKTLDQLDTVIRKTGMDILGSVVAGIPHGVGTPVDTGRARGAWLVDTQLASGGVEVPSGEPNRLDKSGSTTISEGASQVEGANRFSRIVIYNNVPYIQALEYGHSGQAPQGMVRVALRSFSYIVETSAKGAQ